jgi:ribonucleoside-diphosphate reductase beta chain
VLAGYDQLLAAARRLRWDAEAIDLGADRGGVAELPASVRETLTALVAGFRIAERAVAVELGPYVAACPEGSPARACFAVQAGDEARHARFFERVGAEVLGAAGPAAAPAAVRRLFEHELPAVARALAADAETLGAAVGLYHLVLEGIVFAVGQEALLELARRPGPRPRLPGIAAGVARVQADERWHIGLGVLELQRLGAPIDVPAITRAAERTSRAWGPAIATPARVQRALAVHARRLSIVLSG